MGPEEEEKDELLAVPIQLRTPEQLARLQVLIGASFQSMRRKRKKRRKRRTPRTSSCPLRGRRRQRQCLACNAGFPGDVPLRTVFPSVSGRLVMHDIMAGMDEKGFFMFVDIPFVPPTQVLMVQSIQQTTKFPQLLYVSGGRCSCCVGRVLVPMRLGCVPLGCRRPSLAVMDQMDYCSGMYKAGIYGEYAPRALFSSLVGRPRMLVILALMDQKDSCLEEYMFPYTAQCLDFVLHVMRQLTDAFGKNFPHFLDESGPVETPQVHFLDEVVSSSRSSTSLSLRRC